MWVAAKSSNLLRPPGATDSGVMDGYLGLKAQHSISIFNPLLCRSGTPIYEIVRYT
jgi:hypothetical protein